MQDHVYTGLCHVTFGFIKFITITKVGGSDTAKCFTSFLNGAGGCWSNTNKLWQATLSSHVNSGSSLSSPYGSTPGENTYHSAHYMELNWLTSMI